jgi:hypothetical protein
MIKLFGCRAKVQGTEQNPAKLINKWIKNGLQAYWKYVINRFFRLVFPEDHPDCDMFLFLQHN